VTASVAADDELARPPRALGRAAGTVGALTLLSRLTGFARILVVTAVLGRGVLGDTYETANTVPNVLFELVAAGALQAVLVPTLVEVLDRDGRRAAERVAGAVLGCLASLLAALAALVALAAPLIMRAFTAGNAAAVRGAKAELGTLFLWFFLPQVVFYALGLVASAVLNSENRFNVPAVAPTVNNIVVMATYGVFWLMRDGAAPSLDLTTTEKIVLAGGTTLGVIAFTTLPALAAARSGFHLRPRLDWREPSVRILARRGAWAGGQLALAQVLLVAVLLLGNGAPGAVVAWTFAFAFFLLPISLFSIPIAVTMFPMLARLHQAHLLSAFRDAVDRGVRATVVLLVGAAAALAALAWPIVRVAAFGAARDGGLAPLAHAVAAFAPGMVGYGLLYYLTRVSYALGDARTPMVVSAIGTVAGGVVMIIGSAVASPADRAAALAVGYGVAFLISTVALSAALRRGTPSPERRRLGGLAGIVLAGMVAFVVMTIVVGRIDSTSRAVSLITVLVVGAVGAAVYASLLRVVTGEPVRRLVTIDGG
jgi:putative peptidoglycan lipid II flippase